MGEIHVADAFLFATNLLPLLIGMGEEPPNVVDHAEHLLIIMRSPPSEAPGARSQRHPVPGRPMRPYVAV
ncbi:hypothetical protein D3C81_1793780 [compost metagenome]